MKVRLAVSISLILIMLFCTCACAEEMGDTQESEPFVFRNGIMWGDSMEQVIAAENSDDYKEDNLGNWQGIGYKLAAVSNFTSRILVYAFADNQLMCIYYEFPDTFPEESRQYLLAALESKYGESVQTDSETIVQLLNLIAPMERELTDIHSWYLDDGTRIAFFAMHDYYDIYYLFYFDEKHMLETFGADASDATGSYNTSGL
ncbi:MAG: hypothetical protein ACI4P5_05855 [Candidatus Fimadaptatus sp.]